MKRKKLLQHLRTCGCEFLREGGRHSWWSNPRLNTRSAVPRHTEINDLLAKKICKDWVSILLTPRPEHVTCVKGGAALVAALLQIELRLA